MATAASGHHVVVLLEHHVLVLVEVEQADGVQLVGYAAGCTHSCGQAHLVDDALHCGMVGGPLVLAQREVALSLAVVGVITFGRNDPAGPADLLKIHVHLVPGTLEGLLVYAAGRGLRRGARTAVRVRRVRCQRLPQDPWGRRLGKFSGPGTL